MRKKNNLSMTIRILSAVSLLITQVGGHHGLVHADALDSNTGTDNSIDATNSEVKNNDEDGADESSNVLVADDSQDSVNEQTEKTDSSNGVQEINADVVVIPDFFLDIAIRSAAGLGVEAPITKADLLKVKEIDLPFAAQTVRDLSGLQFCLNLEKIEIESAEGLDLSVLRGLQHLNSVYIKGDTQMTNIETLTTLPSLETVAIYDGNVTNIQFLTSIPKLDMVGLSGNPIADFSPLQHLKTVDSLSLTNTNLNDSDLVFISHMTLLRSLTISSNNITDLSPLINMTNLKNVYADRNHIIDLQPVKGATQYIKMENQTVLLPVHETTTSRVVIPYPVKDPNGSPIAPGFVASGSYSGGNLIFTGVTGNVSREIKISSRNWGTNGGTLLYSATLTQPITILSATAIFDGLTDLEVPVGQINTVDLQEGVTATNEYNNIVSISVSGTLGTPAPGTNETYTLTYTATDEFGKKTTATRDVTVTNQLPQLVGAKDFSVVVGANVDLTNGVTASDYEDGDITGRIIVDDSALDLTQTGTYPIVYSVTDNDENTTPVTVYVTVYKSATINAEDQFVQVGQPFDPLAGVTAANGSGEEITNIVYDTNLDTSVAGDYEVTYTVTDELGNEVSKTITITVRNPIGLKGADNVTIPVGQVESFDLLAGVEIDADYHSTFEISYTGTFGTTAAGTNADYVFVYTMTDAEGLTSTHERIITVTNQLPTITGAKDLATVLNTPVDYLADITALDHEDGNLTDLITVDDSAVDFTQLGEYPVVYSVTDSDKNQTDVTVNVIVRAVPTINAEDQFVQVGQPFDPLEGVTAQDFEGKDITDIEVETDLVDTSVPGDYDVTYTVTDEYGNKETITVTVTVRNPMGLNGADDITIPLGEVATFDLLAGISVIADYDSTFEIEVAGVFGTTEPGTNADYVFVYTMTDAEGLTSTHERTITVTNQLPTLTGVQDHATVLNKAVDYLTGVLAEDLEDGDLTATIDVDDSAVDLTQVGEYQVVYTVTDTDGNATSVPATVIVRAIPSINAEDQFIQVGQPFDPLEGVTAQDFEGKDITDIEVETDLVDTTVPGDYEVTYTVTDEYGNEQKVTITVTIRNPIGLDGADNITISLGEVATFDLLAGVTVNADYDSTFTIDVDGTFGTPDAGTNADYVFVYTMTDAEGLTSTHERTITVTNQLPTLSGVKDLETVLNKTVDYVFEVLAEDLEDGNITSLISVDDSAVDLTQIGVYPVVYTITDSDGNVATETINLVVRAVPTINAEDQFIQVGTPFDPLEGVSATDFEGNDILDIVVDTNLTDTTVAGDYDVTYTVTDQYGNEEQVTITVTIRNPIGLSGAEDTTISLGQVDSFDLLEGVEVDADYDSTFEITVEGSLDTPEAGTDESFTIVYTVTDANGLSTTHERVITVTNRLPEILGASDVVIEQFSTFDLLEGISAIDFEDGDITASVIATYSLTARSQVMNTSVPGVYNVTYAVVDSDGNFAQVQRQVTIEEFVEENVVKPNIEVEDQTVQLGDKFDPFAGVTATDSEGNDITDRVEILENNVDTSRPGSYEVTYSVTDDFGNTTIKTIIVTIVVPTTGLNAQLSVLGLSLSSLGLFLGRKKRNKK